MEPQQETITLNIDQALQEAVAHHKAGKLQDAERLYRAILQAQPNHPDANHNLGVLAVQVKQPTSGLPHLKAALQANRNQGQYWLSYIDALMQTGQTDVARRTLVEGRKIGLKGDAVELLAERLSGDERPVIQSNTDKRGMRESLSVDRAMGIAGEHFKAGRLADAEGIYRTVLNAQPNHAIANHNLGLIAHSLGKYEDAIGLFKKAVAVDNNISTFYNNLGEGLRANGQFEEAITAFRRALFLKPDSPSVHNNLGLALVSVDKKVEACESFRQAVELRPEFFHARVQLARMLLFQKRTDEAAGQLDSAALHANVAGFPLSMVGIIYVRLGRPDDARKYLRAAIESDPTDSDGSGLVLAALDHNQPPARASAAYMTKLYAGRAKAWDKGIEGNQSYRGMDLVAHDLRRFGKSGIAVLDAGCGTGLVGVKIRDLAARLEGVDLSPEMLAQAREKGIYDLLDQGDLIEFLGAKPRQYDAITSAATLIHFGDLRPIFEAAKTALKPGGLFVFTVFPSQNDDGFSVGTLNGMAAEGGCYFHGQNYLTGLVLECGFRVESLAKEIHEYRDGEPVMGLITTLRLI